MLVSPVTRGLLGYGLVTGGIIAFVSSLTFVPIPLDPYSTQTIPDSGAPALDPYSTQTVSNSGSVDLDPYSTQVTAV
jgi:hypothetical protein